VQVHFKNNHPSRFWVAICAYDPEHCGGEGGDWVAAGWWKVDTGAEVYAFETDNRYFYFYAHADDGTVSSGDFPTYVMDERFYICQGIGSLAYYLVGMREVDGRDADVFVWEFN
jgi:uncharacterized membrane protein